MSLAADLTGSDPETSNTPYEIVAFVALSTVGCMLISIAIWGVLMLHGVRVVRKALEYSTVPTSSASAALRSQKGTDRKPPRAAEQEVERYASQAPAPAAGGDVAESCEGTKGIPAAEMHEV